MRPSSYWWIAPWSAVPDGGSYGKGVSMTRCVHNRGTSPRVQGAILGLSDQAGVRVSSSTAGESIDRWLEAFSSERAANDQGDKMVGHSTGLRARDKIT